MPLSRVAASARCLICCWVCVSLGVRYALKTIKKAKVKRADYLRREIDLLLTVRSEPKSPQSTAWSLEGAFRPGTAGPRRDITARPPG